MPKRHRTSDKFGVQGGNVSCVLPSSKPSALIKSLLKDHQIKVIHLQMYHYECACACISAPQRLKEPLWAQMSFEGNLFVPSKEPVWNGPYVRFAIALN